MLFVHMICTLSYILINSYHIQRHTQSSVRSSSTQFGLSTNGGVIKDTVGTLYMNGITESLSA